MYCKYILSFASHFNFLPQGGHAVAYQRGRRWGRTRGLPWWGAVPSHQHDLELHGVKKKNQIFSWFYECFSPLYRQGAFFSPTPGADNTPTPPSPCSLLAFRIHKTCILSPKKIEASSAPFYKWTHRQTWKDSYINIGSRALCLKTNSLVETFWLCCWENMYGQIYILYLQPCTHLWLSAQLTVLIPIDTWEGEGERQGESSWINYSELLR